MGSFCWRSCWGTREPAQPNALSPSHDWTLEAVYNSNPFLSYNYIHLIYGFTFFFMRCIRYHTVSAEPSQLQQQGIFFSARRQGDVVLFPLSVLGLKPSAAPPKAASSRSFKQWIILRRWVDGVANACDAYRGLRPAVFAFDSRVCCSPLRVPEVMFRRSMVM